MISPPQQIERLDLWHVRLPMRLPFHHAKASYKTVESVLLRLATAETYGLGEAIPRLHLTGDTINTLLKDICSVWWPKLKHLSHQSGDDPFSTLTPLYQEADASGKTASYAGIDIACFDLWARLDGKPVHAFLGKQTAAHHLTAPVGLSRGMLPVGTLALAALLRLRGYRDFKLKLDARSSLQYPAWMQRVLNSLPGASPACLRADANGAWTREQAKPYLTALCDAQFTSIEEPLAARDYAGMTALQRDFPIAVMADESLCSSKDAKELIQWRAAHMWNIRLAKVGGYSGARALTQLAENAGIAYQYGVLVGETSILQTALQHLLAMGTPQHVEWGFPSYALEQDVIVSPKRRWQERAPLTIKPGSQDHCLGLGVELDEVALAPYVVQKISLN